MLLKRFARISEAMLVVAMQPTKKHRNRYRTKERINVGNDKK